MTDKNLWIKGALGALCWATAITTAHLAHGMGLILVLGQPPHTSFALRGVVTELVMGFALGLLFTPAHLSKRGGFAAQFAGLAALWLVMERLVAVDPSKPAMWFGPTLGALVLLGIGYGLSRLSPKAVVGVAVALPVVLLAAPEIRHAVTAEPAPEVVLQPAQPDAPDVLFIVMDTTRAQSTSAYGYARKTSPVLEKLAAEGVLFEQATAPATWSLPAHAALFTGTFPSFNNAHAETRYLGPELPTIAEIFAEAGYETHCFSANPHISDAFGLTRGFHHSDEAWRAGPGARQFSFIFRWVDYLGLGVDDKGGALVVDNIAEWMDDRPTDGPPAFVFVNFLEAHFPFHQLPKDFVYAFQDRPMSELREAGQIAFGAQFGGPLAPAEVEQIRGPLVDLYDGGVLYTDHLVGLVVDQWRQRGLLDDTVVVVLGDHGEVVGEHDAFGHVTAMVEEDLRVPLVFRYPKKLPQGARVTWPVSTVGTLATLAELADVALPEYPTVTKRPQIDSLLPALQGDESAGKPVIAERYEEHLLSARFAEGEANGKGLLVNPRGRYRSYREGDHKYVLHTTDGEWVFDLRKGEAEPVPPPVEGETNHPMETLKGNLAAYEAGLPLPDLHAEPAPVQAKELDAAEIAQLCALGYMEGDQCP